MVHDCSVCSITFRKAFVSLLKCIKFVSHFTPQSLHCVKGCLYCYIKPRYIESELWNDGSCFDFALLMVQFIMTSSNGTFSALLALCAGNSPVTGEFPSQRPATRSFDVFFDLRLNKRFSKQAWGWWFGTPSRSLWRHCNVWFVAHSRCDDLPCCSSKYHNNKCKPKRPIAARSWCFFKPVYMQGSN